MAVFRLEHASLGFDHVCRYCRCNCLAPTGSTSKALRILFGLIALVAFNTFGGWLASSWQLPLPGALIGLIVLLAVLLTVGRSWQAPLGRVAEPLIAHLSLLFIAPTIGAFYLSQHLNEQLPLIVAILFISTSVAIALLTLLVRWLTRDKRALKQ